MNLNLSFSGISSAMNDVGGALMGKVGEFLSAIGPVVVFFVALSGVAVIVQLVKRFSR